VVDDLLRELIDTGIAAFFDRNPVNFTRRNEKGVVSVRQLMSLPAGQRHTLQYPLPRNSFLCGCLDATEREHREHLLVGFGSRRGSTTRIDGIRHESGDPYSVAVPMTLEEEIRRHLGTDSRKEVVVFHNHPPNWLNRLFDNTPLPSSADRAALLKMRYLEPLTALRVFVGRGNVRFFLGENGYVREFRTPGILQVLALSKRLGIIRTPLATKRCT
jgi:hypothetical protein